MNERLLRVQSATGRTETARVDLGCERIGGYLQLFLDFSFEIVKLQPDMGDVRHRLLRDERVVGLKRILR